MPERGSLPGKGPGSDGEEEPGGADGSSGLPDLHDAVLHGIRTSWPDHACTVDLTLPGRGPISLRWRGVTGVSVPHVAPWGESRHVNAARIEPSAFEMEMQSGDVIRIATSGTGTAGPAVESRGGERGEGSSRPQAPLVVPYDPGWPGDFARIASRVGEGLAGIDHRIEHVGSTSVPGMTAKPIVDLDVVIREGSFPEVRERLGVLGYLHQGDLGLPGREAFDLRDPAAGDALPRHNLYVCVEGAHELAKHLAFRDFLRTHPEWRERLSRLKTELSLRHGGDRQAYIEGKSGMVAEITGLALGRSWALEAEVEPGLSLRPLREEDAEELYTLVDANRAHLRAWLPWLDDNTSPDDSLRFIRGAAAVQHEGRGCTCAILLEGRIAGVVDLHSADPEARSAEIGYWLHRDACGRGVVTRSCRALVRHGFTVCGLDRIVIRAATGNLPSLAIPGRLGFVREGTARESERLYGRLVDLVVHSMLRREWEAGGTPIREARPVEGCPFCAIGAGTGEAVLLWEDDRLAAFLDRRPIREGHCQIITKEHHETFERLPPALADAMIELGQRLARRMKAVYGVDRVAFLFTGGDVPHVHAHVIPMVEGTDVTSARYVVSPEALRFGSAHLAADRGSLLRARDRLLPL